MFLRVLILLVAGLFFNVSVLCAGNNHIKNNALEKTTEDIIFPVSVNVWQLKSGALTVDLWVSPNFDNANGTILYLGDSALKLEKGIIVMESSAGKLLGKHKAISAKQWVHIAVVSDGEELKILLNKKEIVATKSVFILKKLQENWKGIVISKNFSGRRDELRCWTKAFSGDELFITAPLSMAQKFYNTLVGEWRFDGDLTDSKWTTQDGSRRQMGATDIPYSAENSNAQFSEVKDNSIFRYTYIVGYIRGNHILWGNYSREHLIGSSELIYMNVYNDAAGKIVFDYPDNDATSMSGVGRDNSYTDSAGVICYGVTKFAFRGAVGMNVGRGLFTDGDKKGKGALGIGSTYWTVETKLCFPSKWPAGGRLIENECVSIRFGKQKGVLEVQVKNGIKDGVWRVSLKGFEEKKWVHLAIVQESGIPKIFFNKKEMFISSGNTEKMPEKGSEIVVGKNFFGGKMDYLRIWKNEARSVSTFDVEPKPEWADQTICARWEGDVLGRDSASWVEHIRILKKTLAGTSGNTICLGLGNGTQAWKKVLPNQNLRKVLVASLREIYEKYGPNGENHIIDGFDVDFEWIEGGGKNPLWGNYAQQLIEIRDAIGKDAILTCTLHKYYYYFPNTVFVNGTKRSVFDSCDFFTCQNYGPSSDLTSHQSFATSLNQYLKQGFPKDKIILSTPIQTSVSSENIKSKQITIAQRPNFVRMWRDLLKEQPDIGDDVNSCKMTWNNITIPVYFVGVNATKKRAQFVYDNNLPGLMYWDMGEDAALNMKAGVGENDYFSSKSLVAAMNSILGSPIRPIGRRYKKEK